MNKINSYLVARMLLAFSIGALTLIGPSAYPVLAAPRAAIDREDAVITFSRDIFVIVGSTLRQPTEGTDLDAPLFNNAGVNLGLTWGQWLDASASTKANFIDAPKGPRTDIHIQLTGLVPGSVYSVFYGTLGPDSENPLCPNVERTLALTAVHADRQQPDASSFIAGADGTANYHGRVEDDLLSASQVFYTIIYHADGMTSHPLPNRGEFLTQGDHCRSSFGEDAMRQLIIYQKF